MAETNGQAPQPALLIFWDAPSQSVMVQANPNIVKNPSFAAMICKVAEEELQAQVRMQRVAQAQALAAQQAHDQEIANKIMRGR